MEETPRNALAIINRRDEDVREFFSRVIKFQRKEIVRVNKKKDILMMIVLTLAVITLGSFSKSFQCNANINNEVEHY
jgi:hypothetical protein